MRTEQFSKGKDLFFRQSDTLKIRPIRSEKIWKAIETCNRIIKRYGPDPSSFLLRGISKCRIQAVGLGRIDLQRALERLTEVQNRLNRYWRRMLVTT